MEKKGLDEEILSVALNKLGDFLTVHEVAQYLQVKPSTIYEWVSRRFIPFFRFGKKGIRFSKEDIRQWARRFCVELTPEEENTERRIKSFLKDKPPLDIYQVAKKCIAEVRREGYISPQEKPGRDKGLGKEVDHGTL